MTFGSFIIHKRSRKGHLLREESTLMAQVPHLLMDYSLLHARLRG